MYLATLSRSILLLSERNSIVLSVVEAFREPNFHKILKAQPACSIFEYLFVWPVHAS